MAYKEISKAAQLGGNKQCMATPVHAKSLTHPIRWASVCSEIQNMSKGAQLGDFYCLVAKPVYIKTITHPIRWKCKPGG